MSKESFYFSHDYNARTDRKLVNVIMKHGMQGVGVYWCLVEMLYEEGGYMPTEYERISFELRTDTNVIQSIINDFELFKNDVDKFWSDAVLDRLQERCEKSEKARESINKRWDKYKGNTNVIRTNIKRNTIKERKGKKIKDNREYVSTDFKACFELWLKYKSQRSESYKSDLSLKTCYDNLIKLSGNSPAMALEIIEQSMANNWAGLFPLKNNSDDSKNPQPKIRYTTINEDTI